ncbi:hypothetical protein [Curtobacterium sp. RRHDQ10]|uniref:hypothetical protein n=1 Tax=Curtobacterium phyllosphaerae TaxID=3413379 RepID=UPI003BEF5B02
MAGNLIGRSITDLSAGTWFGGSLMGALGLNGAAAEAKDAEERTRLAAIGWQRWAPVQGAATGLYVLGSLTELWSNKGRSATQHGVGRLNAYKAVVLVAGVAATVYTGVIGARYGRLVAEDSRKGEPAEGATEPGTGTSPELASVQKQLRVMQWVQVVFGGWLIVVDAKEGEMQRPANVAKGIARKLAKR